MESGKKEQVAASATVAKVESKKKAEEKKPLVRWSHIPPKEIISLWEIAKSFPPLFTAFN